MGTLGPLGRFVTRVAGMLSHPRRLWARDSGAGSGEALLRAGRFTEAESALARSALENPRNPRIHLALGHLTLMRDDLGAAEGHLKRALAFRASDKDARELLAETHYRRRDFEDAARLHDSLGNRSTAAKLRSFSGRKPYQIAGPDVVRLPFLRRDPLPVVSLRVNGRDEARFLIDTGGGELILDDAFATKVEARRFGAETGYGGGGKSAAIEHGAVDTVALGRLLVRDVPVRIMPVTPMGEVVGEPTLAGILGTTLFYRLQATIDYPGEQLVLRRRDAPATGPGAGDIEVPFRLADDHFMVAEGTLNGGPPLVFFVDTGLAGLALAAPTSTLTEAGIDWKSGPRSSGVGAGGAIDVHPFPVESLTLGGARGQNLHGLAGAFPPALEWELGFRIAGLISHEFFRPYAVTFDFERMVIRLTRSPAE
jgi:predicted aspartyl protease